MNSSRRLAARKKSLFMTVYHSFIKYITFNERNKTSFYAPTRIKCINADRNFTIAPRVHAARLG